MATTEIGGVGLTESKKTIRKAMMTAFQQIDENERVAISKKLQENLFDTELWRGAETIGVYLSMGSEWDTRAIVDKGLEDGKNVTVPKTIPDSKELIFYQLTDPTQTRIGNFGLEEPDIQLTTAVDKDAIDLLIVPGLVFTQNGYRVGFGGGYYDRYLANFIHTTVSLVHTNQFVETFPIESFDIPINYLITEQGIIG